jgi:hypothetical protein
MGIPNPPHPLFGRPDSPSKEGEPTVYARPQQFSNHPGYYDDFEERQAWRKSEHAIPHREPLPYGSPGVLLYNKLGMTDNVFMAEDARASIGVTPAAGTVDTLFSLDRDLNLNPGRFPIIEPGAGVYLGIRGFSAQAIAGTATGALTWSVAIGSGPFLFLGVTAASPAMPWVLIEGFVPYPITEDSINVGTNVGTLRVVSDTLAGPVAIRVGLSLTALYPFPSNR